MPWCLRGEEVSEQQVVRKKKRRKEQKYKLWSVSVSV